MKDNRLTGSFLRIMKTGSFEPAYHLDCSPCNPRTALREPQLYDTLPYAKSQAIILPSSGNLYSAYDKTPALFRYEKGNPRSLSLLVCTENITILRMYPWAFAHPIQADGNFEQCLHKCQVVRLLKSRLNLRRMGRQVFYRNSVLLLSERENC